MNAETWILCLDLAMTLSIVLLAWAYYWRRPRDLSERYPGCGVRFWAGVVDGSALGWVHLVTTTLLCRDVSRTLAALLLIVDGMAWTFYTVVMQARYGQTLGKMMTRMRVVDHQTGENISWRQAWLREGIGALLNLGFVLWEVQLVLEGRLRPSAVANGEALAAGKDFWLLMAVPGLWFLAEMLTMLTNKRRRALHDFIAGTVVIETRAEFVLGRTHLCMG